MSEGNITPSPARAYWCRTYTLPLSTSASRHAPERHGLLRDRHSAHRAHSQWSSFIPLR